MGRCSHKARGQAGPTRILLRPHVTFADPDGSAITIHDQASGREEGQPTSAKESNLEREMHLSATAAGSFDASISCRRRKVPVMASVEVETGPGL